MDCKLDPLIVTFYGGPGSGKSTHAAALFAELKMNGINAELVTEFAKDLTWSDRQACLRHPAFVAAEQMRRMDVLYGQVDVIVTDTSPLLTLVYEPDLPEHVKNWIKTDAAMRDTFDVFLRRNPNLPYEYRGRNEDLVEAQLVDKRIERMLQTCTTYQRHGVLAPDLTLKLACEVRSRLDNYA